MSAKKETLSSALGSMAKEKKKSEENKKVLESIAEMLRLKDISLDDVGDIKKITIIMSIHYFFSNWKNGCIYTEFSIRF